MGTSYYVPRRPFSAAMRPDSITQIKKINETDFFEFRYSFVATGTEKYLSFGAFIEEDTVGAKRALTGNQTVSLVLDNFKLVSSEKEESSCDDFLVNKEKIYRYNSRHKDMDYALYGKGELPLLFNEADSGYITRIRPAERPMLKTDTLKLGDVFFDFNKAVLKPSALGLLQTYFTGNNMSSSAIDSIYVDGHTDSIGTESKNLILSQLRCESIQSWLVGNNITTADRIIIRPFGKTKPVATNANATGRALNRRVEMIIFRN
jgi:outer membrane protein OmpA-like peptidoglycan-associated protein